MHSSQVGCTHGLPVLCVDSGRTYEKLTSFRDAGSDLPDPEIHGETRFQWVVMGSGEPMDNYDNLVSFIRLFRRKRPEHQPEKHHGLHLRDRPEDLKLRVDEGLSITLALSLHAPDDETRKTLMPIANSYSPSRQVLPACKEYYKKDRKTPDL